MTGESHWLPPVAVLLFGLLIFALGYFGSHGRSRRRS
jgi:hypothetical protein